MSRPNEGQSNRSRDSSSSSRHSKHNSESDSYGLWADSASESEARGPVIRTPLPLRRRVHFDPSFLDSNSSLDTNPPSRNEPRPATAGPSNTNNQNTQSTHSSQPLTQAQINQAAEYRNYRSMGFSYGGYPDGPALTPGPGIQDVAYRATVAPAAYDEEAQARAWEEPYVNPRVEELMGTAARHRDPDYDGDGSSSSDSQASRHSSKSSGSKESGSSGGSGGRGSASSSGGGRR